MKLTGTAKKKREEKSNGISLVCVHQHWETNKKIEKLNIHNNKKLLQGRGTSGQGSISSFKKLLVYKKIKHKVAMWQ